MYWVLSCVYLISNHFYKKMKQKFLYPNDDYLLTMVVVMMMVASAYD